MAKLEKFLFPFYENFPNLEKMLFLEQKKYFFAYLNFELKYFYNNFQKMSTLGHVLKECARAIAKQKSPGSSEASADSPSTSKEENGNIVAQTLNNIKQEVEDFSFCVAGEFTGGEDNIYNNNLPFQTSLRFLKSQIQLLWSLKKQSSTLFGHPVGVD